MIVPKIVRVALAKQRGVWLEVPMEGLMALIPMLLPRWDYYHLEEAPFEPEWLRFDAPVKLLKTATRRLKKWKTSRHSNRNS